MRLLTRYVLTELLQVFFVTLVAMTLLILIAVVMKEAIIQGLGLLPVIRLIPYLLPEALRFAVPGTILFAAVSVYGRMSSSNEVVALKSLGISPLPILWPAFALAAVLSVASVWLNDVAVTWGRTGASRVIVESVVDIAYGLLRTQGSYSTKQFAIIVKKVDGRKLVEPVITIKETDDSKAITIIAEEAELFGDPDKDELRIALRDGEIGIGNELTVRFPDTLERVVSLSGSTKKQDAVWAPSQRPWRLIPAEIVKQQALIETMEEQMAATAAYDLATGNFAALGGTTWSAEQSKLSLERSRLYRLQAEPHRRWANGFSCLCFVLVGSPLAIWMKNSDALTSFFFCFGPILIIYYPLLLYGVDQAKSGLFPPYSVWLGNIILGMVGYWPFLRWVMRY